MMNPMGGNIIIPKSLINMKIGEDERDLATLIYSTEEEEEDKE